MSELQLPARERIILAIDVSREADAERLARLAQEAGARSVKLGLELQTATSWEYCSDLAGRHGLDWVADGKIKDIPNTVGKAVRNIKGLEHPPFAITMYTDSPRESMRVAQIEAEDIKMLGVTILTSFDEEEARELYNIPESETVTLKVLQLARRAADCGLLGVVSSPLEVGLIKGSPGTDHLFAMIPGVRSVSADVNDQARVATPGAAIRDGADLLVIGRQITGAEDPAQAYEDLVQEIEEAL